MAKVETGAFVIIVLREPREKIWGILDEINPAGITLRGIDLNAFEDWTRAIANSEPFFGMNDYFLPMWRVEKLTRDESTLEIPSLADRFRNKTGSDAADF